MHKLLSLSLILGLLTIVSCQESLDERAAREAKEYTEKFCPTAPQNGAITDSITFDAKTKTSWTYSTLTGDIDNPDAIAKVKDKLRDGLLDNVKQNTGLQAYKEAGFNFGFVIRSQKHPDITVMNVVFGPKEYNTTPQKK